MKSFQKIALAALFVMAIVSCSKVEKILVKQDGTWKVTSSVTRLYINNQLTQTTTSNGFTEVYTFEKDGTGKVTEVNVSLAFTWTISADQDEIVICYESQGATTCVASTILESEKNKQVWTSTSKEPGDVDWGESDNTYERVD